MYIWVKDSNNEIIFKGYADDFLFLNDNDEILEYSLNQLERQRNRKLKIVFDGEEITITKMKFWFCSINSFFLKCETFFQNVSHFYFSFFNSQFSFFIFRYQFSFSVFISQPLIIRPNPHTSPYENIIIFLKINPKSTINQLSIGNNTEICHNIVDKNIIIFQHLNKNIIIF